MSDNDLTEAAVEVEIDGGHECPAPGCRVFVPFEMLACRFHWYKLPRLLRNDVWRAYRRDGVGSAAHVDAVGRAIDYWSANP